MSSEVSTSRKRTSAVRVQKIENEVFTTVDFEDAPEEIRTVAEALLESVTCCEAGIVDVQSFNGFGDDQYWQIGIAHEALVYRDGKPVLHGRTTIIRISDRA